MSTRDRLTITKPDDWHLHLRDGEQLASVVAHSASEFHRAIIMPNLKPAVDSVVLAEQYRERILAAAGDSGFEPLMTLYLTPNMPASEIERAAAHPHVYAVKLYPAGATTNSSAGVDSIRGIYPVLEAMQAVGLPLLVHGEVTDPTTDVFDREALFIEQWLAPIVERFPALKVVLEHITTQQSVDFVRRARPGVGATITAHHLLHNRNAIFTGGIRPDYYCLPILKREEHRKALVDAATSGNAKFFLGTDSAPHAASAKHSPCGCAGIYTAHAAMPLYAKAFEAAGALEQLEGFASFHGPDFYGLPRNTGTLTLLREPWKVPTQYDFGGGRLTPLAAGEILSWRVSDVSEG